MLVFSFFCLFDKGYGVFILLSKCFVFCWWFWLLFVFVFVFLIWNVYMECKCLIKLFFFGGGGGIWYLKCFVLCSGNFKL